jgi:hypothetical protein
MADKLMTSVLSCLPNTTYDLPADNLPLGSALLAPTIKLALLSMASQQVIIVPTQSLTQAMSMAMV